ncbi:MAG: paraquat-inducible protein A [Pseudomonadota bacterium]
MKAAAKLERQAAIEALNLRYIACPSCDELWLRPQLGEGEHAKCGRCGTTILTNKRRSAERTIALMLASVILYVVAISFPFMKMERSGLSNEISVIDAVNILWVNDMPTLAAICACLILLFPLTRILLLLMLGMVVHGRGQTGPMHAFFFRTAQTLEPWTMAEIFMIGVIVSLVKVGKLATITVGPAFWAMSGLIILLAMGASAVCRDTIWQDIRGTA